MAYLSLYRKWRPQTFDEIAGQIHVTQTLKNAIEQGRISHAYLFCGPRGTGKTTTARVLAKALNCEKGPTSTPCNVCDPCRSINDGSSIDVLELDAASNRKVDEIRDLLEKIPYASVQGGKKVYIIDEVHMLTPESFNTLLKTLEEPPEHVIFILATTEAHKVLPTILSRCQRFDFKRIANADIEARLNTVAEAEAIDIDEGALGLIAYHAQGALRDALGVLDQLASYSKEKITSSDVISLLGVTDSELLFNFADILSPGDLAGGLVFINALVSDGHDLRQFTQDFLGHLRNVFLLQTVPDMKIGGVPDEFQERLRAQAKAMNPRSLMFFINTLNDVYSQSKWATDMRLLLEIALFKMTRGSDDSSIEGILHRIERLEASLESGIVVDRPAVLPPKQVSTAADEPALKPAPKARKTKIEDTAEKVPPVNAKSVTETTPVPEALSDAGLEAVTDTVDIETMKKAWPQVLKIIKEKKKTRYNFFAAAKLSRVDNGRLVLSLKESDKVFIESPDNMKLLRDAIKVASGVDVPIVCELAGELPKTVAVVDGETPEEVFLPDEDYIKLVQDTFGAKIVEEISINAIKSQEGE